jgi:hypothetical protein
VARTDEQPAMAGRREAAGSRAADHRAAAGESAGRPRPYSHADLSQRLDRLPPGHPSSPRNADGSRKPPPPSLRELELRPG